MGNTHINRIPEVSTRKYKEVLKEGVRWTVEQQTLELKTLKPQPINKSITLKINTIIDKCIVPYRKNRRSKYTNSRIQRIKNNRNIIERITILEDRGRIVRILDGNHRLRYYQTIGRRTVKGNIIRAEDLKKDQRKILGV